MNLNHYNVIILVLCLFSGVYVQAQEDPMAQRLEKQFVDLYSRQEVDSAYAVLTELADHYAKNKDTMHEAKTRWKKIAIVNNAARYDSLYREAEVQMEWYAQQDMWNYYYRCWQSKCSALQFGGHVQTSLREAKAMGEDAKMRGNNVGWGLAYKQMAYLYYDMGQYEQAQKSARKSIALIKPEDEDTGLLNGVYNILCQILDKQRDYEKELEAAQEWCAMDKGTQVSANLARAAAYIGMRNFGLAEDAIRDAQEAQEGVKSSVTLYNIFMAYVRMALAKGETDKAVLYSDSAFLIGSVVDDLGRQLRAEAYEKAGRTETALQLYKQLYIHKDSTFTRDLRNQLDELSTLYQVDAMKEEQQRLSTRYMMLIGLLLIGILSTYLILRIRTARQLGQKNRELAEKNEALEIANQQAQEALKMKADFIRNISHEIRTPLNILSGFTQILLSSFSDELTQEEKNDLKVQVEDNTNRITGLIDKLLELSESSSHTVIETCDIVKVGDIAKDTIEHLTTKPAPNVKFNIDIDKDLKEMTLVTNREYAVRVLAQLLDNAFKFTKEGSVTFSLKPDTPVAGKIAFIVEDTGIGIPAAERHRIFEEFVQLDSYYDGTGIGLTVARSVARRLGGDITLDCSYTQGARFVFSLPR